MSILALGHDPDTTVPSLAVCIGRLPIYLGCREVDRTQYARNPKQATLDACILLCEEACEVIAASYQDKHIPRMVLACEGQEVYRGQTRCPADLIDIAHVSGMVAGLLRCDETFIPAPKQWKSSKPKHVVQSRMLSALHVPYEIKGSAPKISRSGRKSKDTRYCVPKEALPFPGCITIVPKKSYWADVLDSMALAHWAMDRSNL